MQGEEAGLVRYLVHDTYGVGRYARYHQDGTSVTGFSLFWNNANGDVNGDRIATLRSALLWAAILGKPFPHPPRKNLSTVSAPSSPTPDSKAKPSEAQFSNGTGFFVSPNGNFVTNSHVVEKCDEIKIKTSDGRVESATLMNADAANDLAALKVPQRRALRRFCHARWTGGGERHPPSATSRLIAEPAKCRFDI